MIALLTCVLLEEVNTTGETTIPLTVTDNAAANTTENTTVAPVAEVPQNTTTEPAAPPVPEKKAVSFFGSAYLEFRTKPTTESKTSNATLDFMYGGSAKNAAEAFVKLGGKAKIFTMIGDDNMGVTMKADLEKLKIDLAEVEVDKKIPTASRITVQVTEKYLRDKLNVSTEADLDDKKVPKTKDVVQVNNDILQKVAYRYLYPKLAKVDEGEFIFADALVNENSIKALIGKYGPKLFLSVAGVENLDKIGSILHAYASDKVNKNKTEPILNMTYLTFDEAVVASKFLCGTLQNLSHYKPLCKEQPSVEKLFYDDYLKLLEAKPKTAFFDYLMTRQEEAIKAIQFMHKLLKTSTLFIRLAPHAVLTSTPDSITYTEHNCVKKCLVSDNGSDDSFAAGYMFALQNGKTAEERIESGILALMTALGTEKNVAEDLSEAAMKKLMASHFVSHRTLWQKEAAPAGEAPPTPTEATPEEAKPEEAKPEDAKEPAAEQKQEL